MILIKNFLLGFVSLVKQPSKYKFIGFLIPASAMATLFIFQDFSKANPLMTFLVFFLSVPVYLCTLGANYKSRNDEIPTVYGEYNNQDSFQENKPAVSHIERTTTTTNTTTTVETIYFSKGENYIE